MRSAAPAMKSATTASTAMPQPSIMMPVWPVATKLVRRPRARSPSTSCSWAVILPTLQSVPTVRHTYALHVLGQARGHRQVGRRAGAGRGSAVPFARAAAASSGSSARKVCSPFHTSQPAASASRDPAAPLRRAGGPPCGAIPITTTVGAERQALLDRAQHRRRAPEAEHVLDGTAGQPAVEHPHDLRRAVADDGVGGLRGHGPEVAVGDDEIACGHGMRVVGR